MKNIWRRGIDVWKVDFLARFIGGLHKDVRTTVWFWVTINCAFAVVVSMGVLFGLLSSKPMLQEFVRTAIPDGATIAVQDGTLTLHNIDDPSLQTLRYEESSATKTEAVLIVDTHGETYNLATLDDYEQGMALFAHKAYVKDGRKIEEVNYSDVPNFQVSKDAAEAWVNRYFIPVVILIAVIVVVILVVMLTILHALFALWWALLLLVTGYIMHVRMPYRIAYMSVLNMYFVPLSVQVVLLVAGVEIAYVTFAIFMAVFIANMLWIHRNARPGDMAHASEQQPSSAEVDSPRVTPAADNRESQ